MSAYICDNRHITYMVQAAISLRLSECDGGSISWYADAERHEIRCTASTQERITVGNMLLEANAKSVSERYSVDQYTQSLTAKDFSERFTSIDPVQVLKAISCYEYQSCEAEDWAKSEAKSFCDRLKDKAINGLIGYSDANWGAPRPKTEAATITIYYTLDGHTTLTTAATVAAGETPAQTAQRVAKAAGSRHFPAYT